MLCDSCDKKRVCKYQEKCAMLESSIMQGHIEDVFSLKVTCKEYVPSVSSLVTNTVTFSSDPNSKILCTY